MGIEDLKKRISEISIGISRVPHETKKTFINLANAEFAGDYGMLLKDLVDDYLEHRDQKMKWIMFENFNFKLDNILEIISQKEQKEIPSKVLTTLGGKRIEVKGGKKDE